MGTQKLLPGGEVVYLVEYLPGTMRWDLSDRVPGTLQVQALVGGLWRQRASLPVAGRPRLDLVPPRGARGMGAYSDYAELTLRDIDADGVQDLQMADGSWVGYSAKEQALVVKKR